jgi:hypothetical protein
METFARHPTSNDLVVVFDMVAQRAVREFNVDGAVGPRMVLVSLDQKQEGVVAKTTLVPANLVNYFFQDAQSQAHIDPFVQDMFSGIAGLALQESGFHVDLVVMVNESQVPADSATQQADSAFDDVVLVTIFQENAVVTGKCLISRESKICSKGSLDLASWVAASSSVTGLLH